MNFQELFEQESKKDYFISLMDFVKKDYQEKTCFPPFEDIFNAFKFNDIDQIKVVILGQDPYHEEHQAHGLSFSILDGNPLPKSLINIYKELYDDVGITRLTGDLTSWAKQGVFLLNNVLTVEKGKANSHKNKGWEIFTSKVIEELNNDDHPKVFVLWGNDAIKKKDLITNSKHLVITSPHPSPLSSYRGFFGSKPFSKINTFLVNNNLEPIDWS
ncbi:MAG: uracil-DNA glycosylase [Bacillales bacterium]|nr:uracil-DNA glycosylase [Bacillales bacterium]